MATAVVAPHKLRSDDIFFPRNGTAHSGNRCHGLRQELLPAGMVLAKLPNGLVHVHGAVFILWIFLLFAQPWLIAAHKVEWHMKLGILSLVLIPSMSILGVLTLFDFIFAVHNLRKVRNFFLSETWKYSFCSWY